MLWFLTFFRTWVSTEAGNDPNELWNPPNESWESGASFWKQGFVFRPIYHGRNPAGKLEFPKISQKCAYFGLFFCIDQIDGGLKWFLEAKKLMWDSLECFAGLQLHFKAIRPLFRPEFINRYFGRYTAGIVIWAILGFENVSYGLRAFICTPRELHISSRTHFKPFLILFHDSVPKNEAFLGTQILNFMIKN